MHAEIVVAVLLTQALAILMLGASDGIDRVGRIEASEHWIALLVRARVIVAPGLLREATEGSSIGMIVEWIIDRGSIAKHVRRIDVRRRTRMSASNVLLAWLFWLSVFLSTKAVRSWLGSRGWGDRETSRA